MDTHLSPRTEASPDVLLDANKAHLTAVCKQSKSPVLFLGCGGDPTVQSMAADGVPVAGEQSPSRHELIITTAPAVAALGGEYVALIDRSLAVGGSLWVYGAGDEMESALARAGFVVGERVKAESGVVAAYRFVRRADTTYPLWHPFQPINGMEQQVTTFVSGKGCVLRDTAGKEYIDASAGLWNTYCGLGEDAIIDAITEQLRTLSYGTLFAWRGNTAAIELARQLSEMAPAPLQWVYLTTSGSEAVELAVKMARLYARVKGRKCREIVYLDESFHGTFFGSMSLSGSTPMREAVGPLLPAVASIPAPNSLKCPAGQSYLDFALSCADALEERAKTGDVAAFIVEPVLGSAGALAPPVEYFDRIQQICRKYDILLMLDEVATGFGRCGRWFAAEHYNLRADILLLSKGMNSGYLPLGAVLFSTEMGEAFKKAKVGLFHGSTYNGHPACCAAATATIKLMRERDLVARAVEMGDYFRGRLAELQAGGAVREVRGLGLMLATVLVQEDGTPATPMQIYQVYMALQKTGVLAYMGPSALTFCPPLIITREEVDLVVDRLRSVLDAVRLRDGNVVPAAAAAAATA